MLIPGDVLFLKFFESEVRIEDEPEEIPIDNQKKMKR
jgi:hypothetical protein